MIEVFQEVEGDLVGLMIAGQQSHNNCLRLPVAFGVEISEEWLAALGQELDRNAEGLAFEIRFGRFCRLLFGIDELNLDFGIRLRIFDSSANHDSVNRALGVDERDGHWNRAEKIEEGAARRGHWTRPSESRKL